MIRSITLPQALVFVACLAAPIAAYKLLGSAEAAGVASLAGMVWAFMSGRPSDAKKGDAS